jgi:hypothetical protein
MVKEMASKHPQAKTKKVKVVKPKKNCKPAIHKDILKAKFEQKIADQNTYGMEEVNDMMKDAKEIKAEKANETNHGEVNYMVA